MLAAMASKKVLSEPDLRKRAKKALEDVRALLRERLARDQDEGMATTMTNRCDLMDRIANSRRIKPCVARLKGGGSLSLASETD
jgi:hypothetical protein